MAFHNVRILVGNQAFQKLRQENCVLFDKTVIEPDGKRQLSLTSDQLKDIFNHNCLPASFAEAFEKASNDLYKDRNAQIENWRVLSTSCDDLKMMAIKYDEIRNKFTAEAPLVAQSAVCGYPSANVVVLSVGH